MPVACCSESFVKLFGTRGTPGRRKLLFYAFFFFSYFVICRESLA